MKTIITAVAVILIASGAWAIQPTPQPQMHQEQGQHQIQGQSQTAIGIGGQGGKGGSATANAPTNVTVTQGVTPAPVVVQEAQKLVPSGVGYLPQQNSPYVQSPDQGTPQTRAPGAKPWNMASHWAREEWPLTLIRTIEVKGVETIEDMIEQPQPANTMKGIEPKITIYKGAVKTTKWKAPHEISRKVYRATEPNVTLFQLQRLAMAWARDLGANGIKVNAETFYMRNTQKGGGITVGMLASAIGSILGQGAVWMPGVSFNFQSWDGYSDVFPVLDVTAIQVQ